MTDLDASPRPGDPDEFAARFVAGGISKEGWTHQAHLVVGLWHVHHYGGAEALVRLRAGIRALNALHGTPNSATGGYHETITRAYVHLLAEFLEASPADLSLRERAERLLASPLAHRDALLRFYSRECLMSAQARAEWVEPDLMAM